jgi:AIR synthase-related protein
MSLEDLCFNLRQSRGFAHKRDISDVVTALGAALPGGVQALAQAVPVGDDCAAIPANGVDGHDGYLLLAIEGLVEDFIERMPWFAGYCSVMVNVSDIYAMGGRPTAVVNALWSKGMGHAAGMLKGMAQASQTYGVPIAGGHSNNQSARPQLAVSILGRANKLLTSFNARPGDKLIVVTDLRGAYEEPFPYWNASTRAPAERLRADLELLPWLAETGLCDAAKDISMAGVVGTTLMLLECSGVGGHIDLDALPRPADAQSDDGLPRWLTAFPSYGFVMSVRPHNVGAVLLAFAARDLACAVVGEVTRERQMTLSQGAGAAREQAVLWDLAQDAFIGEAVSA